ncbi:hypothetical protein NDU88_002363 [Pleurodeles waltl]|uniref:Uncharacterized protein n=1 Tax=Pleurodeles waltl TaxID=8319 RepID=A0AAV7UAJ8_PLEWA|nr:hypothetical protein NDU88_002363 [Pleurodeles waltl]
MNRLRLHGRGFFNAEQLTGFFKGAKLIQSVIEVEDCLEGMSPSVRYTFAPEEGYDWVELLAYLECGGCNVLVQHWLEALEMHWLVVFGPLEDAFLELVIMGASQDICWGCGVRPR